MIESIKHKGLRLLWEKDDPSKLSPHDVDKIRRILSSLNVINSIEPLKQIPGYRLHKLKGKLQGLYSISVTGNYRIIFQLEEENVYNINYIDYH